MGEQPATLAILGAVGPGTDAEGVAAATLWFRREFPALAAGAVALAQAGERRPAPKAVELAARGAPVVAAAHWRLLTLGPRPGQPLPSPGSVTARRPERSGRRALIAAPPKAACYILQGSR